jgi:phosphoribosylformimino-5-aminoimidazole carboxamide ribotide isomerase
MKIFPAIDLYGGSAVRLYKGNYNEMTVYSDNPAQIALDFKNQGAKFMHLVDLEGAKSGGTPNLETIKKIISSTDLFTEVGGGIRSLGVIKKYISAGVNRVILGTSAVTDREFLVKALELYGDKIAVGVDIKDGFVAIKGWTEKSSLDGFEFMKELEGLGVKTVICTDISKDGAMQGTNHSLYKKLSEELSINVIASGGVSSIDDIVKLKNQKVYGAIIGKAYYVKAIDLKTAIEVANDN